MHTNLIQSIVTFLFKTILEILNKIDLVTIIFQIKIALTNHYN